MACFTVLSIHQPAQIATLLWSCHAGHCLRPHNRYYCHTDHAPGKGLWAVFARLARAFGLMPRPGPKSIGSHAQTMSNFDHAGPGTAPGRQRRQLGARTMPPQCRTMPGDRRRPGRPRATSACTLRLEAVSSEANAASRFPGAIVFGGIAAERAPPTS